MILHYMLARELFLLKCLLKIGTAHIIQYIQCICVLVLSLMTNGYPRNVSLSTLVKEVLYCQVTWKCHHIPLNLQSELLKPSMSINILFDSVRAFFMQAMSFHSRVSIGTSHICLYVLLKGISKGRWANDANCPGSSVHYSYSLTSQMAGIPKEA